MSKNFKILLLVIAILIFAFLLLMFLRFLSQRQLDAQIKAIEETTSNSAFAHLTQAQAIQMWWQDHLGAVQSVGDSAFTTFVETTIQNKCPYYVPDGYTYRGCMDDFITAEEKTFTGGATTIQGFKNYCTHISSPYSTGTEGVDLFSSCLAYKLSSKPN